MPNTDPPVPLPDRDFPLWNNLKVSFDRLDDCMGRRPQTTLENAEAYHRDLVEALHEVGIALEAVGLADVMDGWGTFLSSPGSYARNLLQLTRDPTPRAVAKLLGQNAKAPRFFDQMRRVVRQFAERLLAATRPTFHSAGWVAAEKPTLPESARTDPAPSTSEVADPAEDPFTLLDRTGREVYAGELADLDPRSPPIPLLVDARRTNLRARAEQLARSAAALFRDKGATLTDYEGRLLAFGRSIADAMSYGGPMWWLLGPVERGARLLSLLGQVESSCRASADLLRMASGYCSGVAEPKVVGRKAVPPTWEDLLHMVRERIAALCPEGSPEPPPGFRGELLVAVRTRGELAEWIKWQMDINDRARRVSRPTPTGESGLLRNAYCLARPLGLWDLPKEPPGTVSAADEEIHLRNLLMALDRPAPDESAARAPRALNAWRERKLRQQDEASQRADREQGARKRLAALADHWEQAQRACERLDDEATANRFEALARLLNAEGLMRCFEDPDIGHSDFPPDEADARMFVADLLRAASRGDRDGVLSALGAGRTESEFFTAVRAALVAARRHAICQLKADLAKAIGCVPVDPCLDYDNVDPNPPVSAASEPDTHSSASPPVAPTASGPSFDAAHLDPSRCPGCGTPVPRQYSARPVVLCVFCKGWELHTGVTLIPVAGPVGTPPQLVSHSAPYWQARLPGEEAPLPGNGTPGASVAEGDSTEEDRWISVNDAAKTADCNSGVITRAADAGSLKSNGEKGRARRIDAVDLTRWIRERANRPEPGESAATIQKKVDRHCRD